MFPGGCRLSPKTLEVLRIAVKRTGDDITTKLVGALAEQKPDLHILGVGSGTGYPWWHERLG